MYDILHDCYSSFSTSPALRLILYLLFHRNLKLINSFRHSCECSILYMEHCSGFCFDPQSSEILSCLVYPLFHCSVIVKLQCFETGWRQKAEYKSKIAIPLYMQALCIAIFCFCIFVLGNTLVQALPFKIAE